MALALLLAKQVLGELMGNPSIFYKRALQNFAHCLAAEEDKWALAKQLYAEESEEILEEYILKCKSEMDEIRFFYDAGRTCQVIFHEAYEEGCDAINASIGGVSEFDSFIGLKDEED
jgi:hypothetical protein